MPWSTTSPLKYGEQGTCAMEVTKRDVIKVLSLFGFPECCFLKKNYQLGPSVTLVKSAILPVANSKRGMACSGCPLVCLGNFLNLVLPTFAPATPPGVAPVTALDINVKGVG